MSSTVTEGTSPAPSDFPNSAPGYALPVGTTTVFGQLHVSTDSSDWFEFSNLVPGSAFSFLGRYNPFGQERGVAFTVYNSSSASLGSATLEGGGGGVAGTVPSDGDLIVDVHFGQIIGPNPTWEMELTGTVATTTFMGGGGPVAVEPGVALVGSGSLVSGTIAIGSGFINGDALNFTNQNGITGSYNAATGILTLSGTATYANYQAAVDSVTFSFNPTNGDPTNGGGDTSRAISWALNNGTSVTSSGSSTLDVVHVAPTITADGTATFSGGGAPVVLDGTVAVSDPDSLGMLNAGTVSITNFQLGDILSATPIGSISVSYDATTGILTLSGADTLADYQQVLDSITYSVTPSNADPTGGGGNTSRTIDWTVNDGVSISNTGTSTLNVVHVAPTLTATGTVTYDSGSPASVLDSAVTLADVDSGGVLTGATVAIAGGFFSGDVLNFTNAGGITGSYNSGTGVLVLSGTASVATYQGALASITYSSSTDPSDGATDPTRTINWSVSDGNSGNGISNVGTTSINVYGPPASISGVNGVVASFVQQGPATTLDNGFAISDPDSTTLVGAVVKITNGFFAGDTLTANVSGTSITTSYNAGTLTLSGTDTLADYQQVLRSIAYSSSATDPTDGGTDATRTIIWRANDGRGGNNLSNIGTSVVDTHVRPVVTTGNATDFITGGGPILAQPTLTVVDSDINPIVSGTVAIVSGRFTGDVLAFNNGTNIETFAGGVTLQASYNSDTGLLTLIKGATSNPVSAADWQQALDSVTFNNTGINPSNGGVDLSRTLRWTLNTANPQQTSVPTTSTIDLPAPPVISGTLGGQATSDEAPINPMAGVTITDPNPAATETVVVTLSNAAHGTLSDTVGGVVTGGTYVVTGSTLAVTQALEALTFTPTPHEVPPGDTITTTFTLAVTDSSGATASNSSVSVVATAVNDPPAITLPSSSTGVPNQSGSTPFAGVSIVDPDIGHTDTVVVTMSTANAGTFSMLGGGTYDPSTGTYSVVGDANTVTTALDALVFTPAPPPAGSFVTTTGFTITATGPGGSATNNAISVTSANQTGDLGDSPEGNDIVSASPDGTSFPAATAGMNNEAVVTAPVSGGSYALPSGYQAGFLGGTADAMLIDSSVGGALLAANSGNDTLYSAATADTLVGGFGSSTFLLGGANNVAGIVAAGTVSAFGSGATVFAGSGQLTLTDTGTGNTFGLSSGTTNATLSGSQTVVYAGSGDANLMTTGDNVAVGGFTGSIAATLGGANDVVYAGTGTTALMISGANDAVGGSAGPLVAAMDGSGDSIFGSSGSLALDASGVGEVIGLANGSAAMTLAGSGTGVFGGSGALQVLDFGNADTVEAASGQTSVSAAGTNAVVANGSGSLNFINGGGNSTVFGGSGTATVQGGTGGMTLFGGAGGQITFIGNAAGMVYQAGSGNETLNAAQATTNDVINGGIDSSGQNLLIAGSGNDSLYAGTGSDTFFGGNGSDQFVFSSAVIAGSAPHDVIANFTANDTVMLNGYGSGQASAALSSAVSSGGSTTLTLFDNTQITFLGLASSSSLMNHVVST